MPFAKGQSGNPSGRPKVTLPDGRSVTDVAREYTVEALETLVDAMRAPEAGWNVRRAASEAILDRGWGRPKQEVDHAGTISGGVTRIELVGVAAAIAEGRARVNALNGSGEQHAQPARLN